MPIFNMPLRFDTEDLSEEKQRRKIMSYLVALNEQLRYVLANLDEENLGAALSGTIEGKASAKSVHMLQEMVAGVNTEVKLTPGRIEAAVQEVPGLNTGTEGGVRAVITKDTIGFDLPGADGDTHWDADGMAVNNISAKRIESESVCAAYAGENSLSAGNGELQTALERLGNRLVRGSVTITLTQDVYESQAVLSGAVGSGEIHIDGGGHTLNGNLTIKDCACKVYVDNLTIVGTVEADNVFARFHNCTINGNGAEYALRIPLGGRVMIWECGVYNATHLIYVGHASSLSAIDLLGGNGTNFLYGDGAGVIWSGTRPDGNLRIDNPCLLMPADPTQQEIDYGTATPTVPPTQTAAFTAHTTVSYKTENGAGRGWYTGALHQGIYDGIQYSGCMFFDLSALAGKTVKSAKLTINRVVSGTSGTVTLTLWVTRVTGSSGNAMTNAGSYGEIGTISPNTQGTFGISAQAVQELIDGTAGGLMLYTGETEMNSRGYSRNYTRFGGVQDNLAPVLTVEYQ